MTKAEAELKQLGGIIREFTKSKEGVEQYEKLGLKYNENLQDELYEKWLSETSAENLSEFTDFKEKEITSIHVKQIGTGEYDDNGKEKCEYYCVWDCMHTRVDRAGNPVQRYLPNQGIYPIPRPHYKLGTLEFGKTKREIDYIESHDTGYTTPWTKANLLKLIKEIPLRTKNKGPSVGVVTSGGIRFHIERFDNLLNAKSFDELMGKDVNDELIAKVIRQRNNQQTGVTEKPLTASDVEAMLEKERQSKEQK
jgi:hypothetical protein